LAHQFLSTLDHWGSIALRDLDSDPNDERTLFLQSWPQAGDELVEAMRCGALDLHYQPIFDLRSLELTRREALVRWEHSRLGQIPACNIVSIARQHKLSRKLTEYVLRRACLECASWPSDLSVAVNITASDLRSFRLRRTVEDALRDARLPARRLELEIGETEPLTPDALTLQSFHALQDLGVPLAMDNFGSGFATANCLLRFAFDRVKIDRSLLEPSGTQGRSYSVLKAVRAMFQHLQLPTAIGGIETAEQLALVRELGFGEGQGFLLGKPERSQSAPHTGLRKAQTGHFLFS
jgi:EAL domain-containing protein (putative c-di-GMP-specific phosphodiesterase class I)